MLNDTLTHEALVVYEFHILRQCLSIDLVHLCSFVVEYYNFRINLVQAWKGKVSFYQCMSEMNRILDNKEISVGADLHPSWLSVIIIGKANYGGFLYWVGGIWNPIEPVTLSWQLRRHNFYYGAAVWVTTHVTWQANQSSDLKWVRSNNFSIPKLQCLRR